MSQTPLGPNTNDSRGRQGLLRSAFNRLRSQGSQDSSAQNEEGVPSGVERRREAKTTFGQTTQLRYPLGVGEELGDEQPHWLKILVRVREQNSQATSGNVVGGTYQETAARRLDQESAASVAAKAGAATGASQKTGGLLGLIPLGNFFGRAVKAGAGGLVGAAAALASGSNKSTTLNTSICLGLQEPPKADYNVEWEEQALGSVLSGGKQGLFNTAKGLAGESLRRKINPGKLGEAAGFDQGAAQAAVDKSFGKVRNPYKEQIFKQVNFRDFTFEYTFLPDSVQEAQQVINIIKILRQNMLPEVAKNSFYLVYPSEFSLFYMYKGDMNEYVHQFSDCVLTGMTLKYGGQDFVTFKGEQGLPAEVTMTLKFREIVPITGDRVAGENL
jgi:hypothetical protein